LERQRRGRRRRRVEERVGELRVRQHRRTLVAHGDARVQGPLTRARREVRALFGLAERLMSS
jgi:hypothetical protein